MSSDWKSITLDQAIHINPKVPMIKGDVYPFVDMQSVEVGQKYVSANEKREFKNSGSRFSDGDTLMARITPCLQNGKITRYRASNDQKDAHGSTEFIVLRNREGVTYKEFVYYLVISDQVKPYAIAQMNGSSGRQRVPVESFKHLELKLPPFSEQVAIANLLKSLDDKIELNRQICIILEDIASTLFKSWFIDFDPVKAKAAGRNPEGLSQEVADLFPDSFTSNELPSGWHFSVAYDWAEYINGAAYKDFHFTESINGLPIIKIAELKSGISSGTKYSNVNLGDKYKIDTGNILLSWSGSPETSIDTFLWVGGAGWLNQHIFNVIPKSPESRTFIYFLLKYLKPTLINIAKNKQTTGLGHITVKDLKELKVVNPGSKLIKSFDLIVAPTLQRIQQSMEENICLSRTRNNLLPQLINGSIKVNGLDA